MTDNELINTADERLTLGFDEKLHTYVFHGAGESRKLIGYLPKEVVSEFDEAAHEWIVVNFKVVGFRVKTEVLSTPVIELTNIAVASANAELGAGNIWWLPQGEQFTLTANVSLPDANMMIIIERVASGSTVIDDVRVKATIENGVVTINAAFAQSGNYQITAERLNAGLDIIGAGFNLVFDKIEFDAYV